MDSERNEKEDVLVPAQDLCEDNDAALLNEAASVASGSILSPEYLSILRRAIANNSIATLSHLVKDDAMGFKALPPSCVATHPKPSITTLDFLFAHGWDINNCREPIHLGSRHRDPFLWHVTSDEILVQWCLDHGARVQVTDRRTRPILETAANCGSFAAFRLLYSAGAPPGRRTLHLAVQAAALGHIGSGDPEKDTEAQRQKRVQHDDRMALVRYLIDVVALDVNAEDWMPGAMSFSGHGGSGTPICYVISHRNPERVKNARDLTWLLLDRGADPTLALEDAVSIGMTVFIKHVDEWKEQMDSGRARKGWKNVWTALECCVQ